MVQQTKPSVETKTFFEKAKDVGKVIKKAAIGFVVNHPVATAIGVAIVSRVVNEAVNGGKSSNNSSGSSSGYREDSLSNEYENNYDYEDDDHNYYEGKNDDNQLTENGNIERASRDEYDVPAHRQRYHTKDGVIWKDKASYHCNGNKEE